MNCAEFCDLIQDLAREDAPTGASVTDALAHAESCRACDALLREAEQTTVSLHTLATQHRFDAAPSRVEAALLQEFRQQHAPAPRLRRVGGWLAVSTAGLVTATLLTILLTGYRPGISPAPARVPESAPRQSNQPSIQPRTTWADYATDGETAEQAAASYIPLAADFDPSWLEGGAIVRVELSRPALESMGVPMSAEGDGQMVADMVVSNEGTPEAIRIVDWQASDIQ
jgi:hypothetical protein